MADNVIGIKFGVAGGKGFQAGSSGALIKEQLEYLASRIKLKVNINKTYFKNQLSSLKKELDKALGELNINVRANVKPNVQGGGSSGEGGDSTQQVASYESVTKALEKLYQTRAKLLKMPKVGDQYATVAGQKASKDAVDLEAQFKQQLEELEKLEGVDKDRVQAIKEYRDLLEQAYQLQKKSTEKAQKQSQAVSPTAGAKLQRNAASLYVDNGFDKVIARSKKAKRLVDMFAESVRNALNQNGGELTKEQVEKLNTQFLQTQARLKEIARETNTVGNKIREAFNSRFIQRIAQILLLAIGRALRQVYQNVKAIDEAMTELRIITRATSKEMDEAAKNIAKSAKEIGASITDLTKSTSVYARLGYDLPDAQTLAKKTTMYANISGVNVNEATTNITGIIKAYNIGAEGLEDVLDQLIWVGNTFAISQAEIGEAMNNAASALAANGNTLQEAIGIVTAANASLQNVSKSSTAVRTIAARISASTAELQELGEDAGDILSTADLDMKMRAFGVAISGANGELRSTYDILGDLAKNWNNFSDAERAAIADMLAGTRQQNAFYSIMQNWQDATNVVNNATQGVGSLQEAQEVYIDSIEGKANKLKAAWEEFSTSLLDSGVVKFFMNLLTGIAQVLNAIISLGNGFVAKGAISAAAIIGVIAAINKLKPHVLSLIAQSKAVIAAEGSVAAATKLMLTKIRSAMAKFLLKNAPIILLTTILTLMTSLEGEAKGFAEVIVGVVSIIATAVILGVKAIDAAVKKFKATNPIGWILLAITAVISVVKGIFDLIESFNPSYETLKEAAQESIDAWKEAEDELDQVKDKLEEIRNKIDEINNKDNITLVDKEELKYLEEQKANLEAVEAMKEEEAKKAKQKAATDAANALGKYNDTHTVDDAPWYEWMLIGPWAFIHQGIAWGSDTYEEKFNEILKNYQSASQEDKDFITSTLKEYGEMLDGFDFGDNADLDPYLAQYYRMIDSYNLQTGNAAQTWRRVLADSRFSSEVEKLQQLADSQGVSMDAIAAAAPQFLDYLKQIGVYIDGDTASADALVESIRELRHRLEQKSKISFTDDIEIMQDKFDSLSKGLKDIDNTGVISMDNIAKILDKDAEGYPKLLAKYFQYVDGVGYQLTSRWADKTKSEILNAMARDEIQIYADELADAQATLSAMASDNEGYETATNNVAIAQENLNTKITEWATLLREQALEDETDRLKKLQEALEAQEDKYKELIDIRRDLLETYKEEVSYQKELAKKQKNVADLQTQLSLAMLDKSASGQANARDLQEQLNNARDELDDYTLDKAIKDLTSQLDEDYDVYKEFLQEEIDKIIDEIANLASTFKIDFTPNDDGTYTVKSHHTGGFVGDVISLKSNEEFAKLLNGELVSTPQQMDSFMRRTLPSMLSYDNGKATINNNSPLIEIKCGDIDRDTLPQLKALVDQAVSRIEKNMESALVRTGYKKKY